MPINKFWILIIALGLSSCTKFLTHDDPVAVTDETWWKTEANATGALGSVYAGLPGGSDGRQLMFLSALSDEAVARQDTRGSYELYGKGLANSSWNVALSVWQDDFKDIRRACRFLENVDRCFMDSTLRERYKNEARAMRAYYHMELLMFFGGIPIVTESVDPLKDDLKRNTEQEVYDFVMSELTACIPNLPASYNSNEAWRISSGVCYALMSKLAMYYGHFDVAKSNAKAVIDQGTFALYKSTNAKANSYAELFLYTGELNKERIFFKDKGCAGAWLTFAPAGVGGKTVVSPTNVVLNNFETLQGKTLAELPADSQAIYRQNPNYKNNRDPRLVGAVLLPGQSYQGITLQPFAAGADQLGAQNATATGFWVNKYLDPKDRNAASANRTLDYMIIRYPEVLLNYVEALIETADWQNPDVLTYINQIRNRAGMPAADGVKYNSQEKLRDLVRRERMSELCFEGARFFDIRRWKIFGTVMTGQVYGATNPATGEATPVETRNCNPDRDVRYPIPLSEMLANPNMEQNYLY
ncbi:RagB/SusD family nutrient uptake outer membrane protein [Chitinophaga sp. sic0106]|uniref:RagB/SusD family nutrient uptake outer membrane protein n=1 Tax=Chitinophaga sp. sic0106 TaxID=2854785 RepID=UPI001C47675F|nr:RagB/SusD family nutrient uptake outer membrane protein [Chitinophaga sp. sic0106]MBV7530571.1 RagB/SusD family nutrient uptake outer membrane protein [Chitinophaga sp. sic0106]